MGEFVTKSMWIGAIPLLLIGAADTFFAAAFAEAIPPAPVVYYTFLVWSGIAAVAALAVIPNVSVRWIVAALLLAAAIAEFDDHRDSLFSGGGSRGICGLVGVEGPAPPSPIS